MSKIMTFPARLVRWVDGDTCRVDIDQGFYDWKMNREVRLYGLNVAENRSSDVIEKFVGSHATQRCKGWIREGSDIILHSYPQENDKYGRVIGEIVFNDLHWSEVMAPYARKYGEEVPADYWQKIKERIENGEL